jgi:hypothetical protein
MFILCILLIHRVVFEKFDNNFNLRYQGIVLEFSKNSNYCGVVIHSIIHGQPSVRHSDCLVSVEEVHMERYGCDNVQGRRKLTKNSLMLSNASLFYMTVLYLTHTMKKLLVFKEN